MLLSAFTGDAFQRAVINGFSDGIRIGSELQILVENTAKRIPVQVSSNWLNWIIARMFVVLPTQYLLQTNTCVNHKTWPSVFSAYSHLSHSLTKRSVSCLLGWDGDAAKEL